MSYARTPKTNARNKRLPKKEWKLIWLPLLNSKERTVKLDLQSVEGKLKSLLNQVVIQELGRNDEKQSLREVITNRLSLKELLGMYFSKKIIEPRRRERTVSRVVSK